MYIMRQADRRRKQILPLLRNAYGFCSETPEPDAQDAAKTEYTADERFG